MVIQVFLREKIITTEVANKDLVFMVVFEVDTELEHITEDHTTDTAVATLF